MADVTDHTHPDDDAAPKRVPKAARIAGVVGAITVCIALGFCMGRYGHSFLFPEDRSFEICKFLVNQQLYGVAEVRGRRVSDREIELSFQADDVREMWIERSPGAARCEFSKTVPYRDPAVRRIVINGRSMRPDAIEAAMQYWVSDRR